MQRNNPVEWHFGTPNATPQGSRVISKAERIENKKTLAKKRHSGIPPKTMFLEDA